MAARGFRFADKTATQDGIHQLRLLSSDRDRSLVVVKGMGSALPDPALPLSGPVLVQVENSETGYCVEATFVTPTDNDSSVYRAKN